jgi:hypothetical protein
MLTISDGTQVDMFAQVQPLCAWQEACGKRRVAVAATLGHSVPSNEQLHCAHIKLVMVINQVY